MSPGIEQKLAFALYIVWLAKDFNLKMIFNGEPDVYFESKK
jgi:hypothetical protein